MLLPASSGPPIFSYKGSSSGGFIDHKRKGLGWGRKKINGLWASLGRTETCFSQKKQKSMELSGNIREKNVHFCFRRDLVHRSIDGFEIWARFELPRVRKSGFRNPESRALECGIHLKESGIPLTIGTGSRIQVPLTKTGMQYLEPGIHGVESRIQDCLGFPKMDRFDCWVPLSQQWGHYSI